MNLEIKEAGDARKVVNVSFDSDEVSAKDKEVCREFGRLANIPGFRKGKAPEQVIRKRYSKEMLEELTRKVSTAAYEAVLENKDIKVYSILKVDAGELKSGEPANVEITVDIESDFDLPKYEEFELSVESTEISDEEVEKELEILEIKEHLLMKSTGRLKLVIMLNAHTKECLMVHRLQIFYLINPCMGNKPILGKKPVKSKAWELMPSHRVSLE